VRFAVIAALVLSCATTPTRPEAPFPGGTTMEKPGQQEAVAFYTAAIKELVVGKDYTLIQIWWYKEPCIVYFPSAQSCIQGLASYDDDGCTIAAVWTGNFHDGILAHELLHCALNASYGNGDGQHTMKNLWQYVEHILPKLMPERPKFRQWTKR